MLIDKLLKNYNTDVRPVENKSQVLEVALGLQPYRLLRVVGKSAFVMLYFLTFCVVIVWLKVNLLFDVINCVLQQDEVKQLVRMSLWYRLVSGYFISLNLIFSNYSWLACDVIIFQNPKLKSHLSFYPHQALDGENWHLFTTFQLSSLLRLETSAFWISELWRCVT